MHVHAGRPTDHAAGFGRRQFLAALALAGAFVDACASRSSPAASNNSNAATAVARVSTGMNGLATAGQAVNATVVRITTQNAFEPATVTVPIGATISWQNDTSTPQSATFDPGQAVNPSDVVLPPGVRAFDSGLIQPKQTWSHRFTTSGTYHYVSTTHDVPGIKGTVVVTS